jgi:hypothetical protein
MTRLSREEQARVTVLDRAATLIQQAIKALKGLWVR